MTWRKNSVLAALVAPLLLDCQSNLTAAEWTVVKSDNLSEWSDPGTWWRTEKGVFIADSKGGPSLPKIHYLEWKGSTGNDFELSLEYRIMAKSPQDAGVNFRVERPHAADQPNLPSYQVELDTCNLYGNQRFIKQGKLFGHIHDGKRSHMFKRSLISTGQADGRITSKPLRKRFDPVKVFRKPPEWNHCRVRAVGEHVQLFLNGTLANEIYDRDPKKRSTGEGIALQYRPNGGYRFEVRDLKFRPASSAPTSSSPAPGPKTGPASLETAGALALAGKHAEAATMFEEIFAADRSAMNTMGGLSLATLYAATGEKDKHRRFCANFMQKFSKWKVPADAERPAKAYLLYPGASDPELLKKADAATRHAVQKGRGGMRVWFEVSRGMAQYRLGDHAGAARTLRNPMRGKHPSQRIDARAFAAMAAFRMSQVPEARKLLAEAEGELKRAVLSKLDWNNLVASQIAIEEARSLIK